MIKVSLQIRRAVEDDHQQIASLMGHEATIHRHLDWRSPLNWLGAANYWVLEDGRNITAVLACPEDPPHVAWIRLFGYLPDLPAPQTWKALWAKACEDMAPAGKTQVAAIVVKRWFHSLLISSGFEVKQNIILLELKNKHYKSFPLPQGVRIRHMLDGDIRDISLLDSEAFGAFWQNTEDTLRRAYSQAVYASVAEDDSGVIGYQISTGNPFGAHLGRLGVRPGLQGKGIGAALVSDLIHRLDVDHLVRLSVNTQTDNTASLQLYEKIGFMPTGENFPVLVYPGLSR